jgi:hypothetical protein
VVYKILGSLALFVVVALLGFERFIHWAERFEASETRLYSPNP